MLRGFWHISQQDEWEAMTGLVTVSIASQKVFTETWEMSTNHSDALHLPDYLPPVVGQSVVARLVQDAIGPVVGVVVGEGHVADAERVQLAQYGQVVHDGVAALEAEDARQLPLTGDAPDVRRRAGLLDLVRVALAQEPEGVGELQDSLHGHSLFHVVGVDVRREELGGLVTGPHPGQVQVAAPRVGPQVVAVVDGAAQAVRVRVDDGGREVQVSRVAADHVYSPVAEFVGSGGPEAHYIGGDSR